MCNISYVFLPVSAIGFPFFCVTYGQHIFIYELLPPHIFQLLDFSISFKGKGG